MQAASSQSHQMLYLPFLGRLYSPSILYLYCVHLAVTWSEKIESDTHAIAIAGVIAIDIAIVVDITKRRRAACVSRAQRTYRI